MLPLELADGGFSRGAELPSAGTPSLPCSSLTCEPLAPRLRVGRSLASTTAGGGAVPAMIAAT
jgi:hypothetical protein